MSFLVWKGTVLPGCAGMWASLTEKHSCLVFPRSSVIWICPHRLLQTPTRAAPAHCPLHPPRLTVGLYAPSTLLWRQKAAIKLLLSARVCNSQEIRTGNAPAAARQHRNWVQIPDLTSTYSLVPAARNSSVCKVSHGFDQTFPGLFPQTETESHLISGPF